MQSCYYGLLFAETQTREAPEQDRNYKPTTNLQGLMGNVIDSSKSFYIVSMAFISFFLIRIL